MQQYIGCVLSAIIGAFIGGCIVLGWMRAKYERVIVYDRREEPCFPPKLTLIESRLRTGTDHSTSPIGRGW